MAEPTNDKPLADMEINEKVLNVDGYEFKVDTDLLDDVDAFKLINKIENDNQITAVVPLMDYLIGADEFNKMKAYFVQKDAEAHKDVKLAGGKKYHPRLRLAKLGEIYQEIIKNFDPKD